MLNEIDYYKIRHDLLKIQYSKKVDDILEYARHYGALGYSSITAQRLIEAGEDVSHIERHLVQLDSLQQFEGFKTQLIINDFSNIPRGNCLLSEVSEVEIVVDSFHLDNYEAGEYIHLLPYIEHVKNLYNIDTIKINCNKRVAEVFEEYFPYIKVGSSHNKVTNYEVIECVARTGGAAAMLRSIKQISKRIVGEDAPEFVATHWFSNTMFDRYRSIPMGVLINTIGNTEKNLNIMSLQYNDPKLDIELFNKYSKNKIKEVYHNDINTSLVDTISAVSKCYMYVGIQSEVSTIAFALCGIPTMITASSPNIYWYLLNGLNPYINIAKMRYSGDYEYITDKINKFI
jgi:hypothetical protein